MIDVISSVALETWWVMLEAAPWVLLGFFVAGILYIFIKPAIVSRYLGKGRFRPVFLSALFGVPIPLCSCGVVPTALSLRKQGANDGATVSFLVSTPETGVDSIAITYALMDPLMTVFRPVAAFFTAVTAGILQNVFGNKSAVPPVLTPLPLAEAPPCTPDCGCEVGQEASDQSVWRKAVKGVTYAFGELMDDMAGWLALGIVLAGIISVALPPGSLERYIGTGIMPMIVMLAAGIPMYICATASTPIAAALMMKGLSPGAALVFLLAGPATNIASVTVVAGAMGKRAAGLYLASISVCSVLLGLLLDFIYINAGLSLSGVVGGTTHVLPTWLETASALVLTAILARSIIGGLISKKPEADESCGCDGSCSPH